MTRWQREPQILSTELHDEVVLLHPVTQALFTLNATALVVWNRLEEPAGLDRLVADVTDTFEIDAARATTDIRLLIGELVEAGLIHER